MDGVWQTVSHTNALFRKSLTYQKRQTGTNVCQVVTVAAVVVIMIALQAIVNDLIEESPTLSAAELVSPPTRPPFLIRAFDGGDLPSCAAVPDGPLPRLCNASSCPPQPPLVFPAALWAVAPDPAVRPRFASLLDAVDRSPLRVHLGAAYPEFDASDLCYSSTYWAYPLTVDEFNSTADVNAITYNSFGKVGRGRFGGWVARDVDVENRTRLVVDFGVHFNETLTSGLDVLRLSSLLVRAAVKKYSGATVDVVAGGVRDFPRDSESETLDIISLLAPFILIYVFQLTLPPMLTAMVFEREFKLLAIMKMMGLRMPAYWAVTYTFNFLLYFISVSLFWLVAALAGFRVFVDNAPGIIFVLLFLFGHCLVASSFALRAVFAHTTTATVCAYLYIFSTGLLGSEVMYAYMQEPKTPAWILTLFSCLTPSLAFYRGLVGLTNGVAYGEPGLEWGDVSHPRVRMDEVFAILAVQWVLLLLVAAYLDAVVSTGFGLTKHPLFFLHKSSWAWLWSCCGGRSGAQSASSDDSATASATVDIASEVDGEPADVAAVRAAIRGQARSDYALLAADVSVTYPARGSSPPKRAVIETTLAVERGEVYGLLGSNGAGKSSLISALSGLIPPTSGAAYLAGHSMADEAQAAHMHLGVCPQNDLLWLVLTGPEHLRFYGRVKGLSGAALTTAIDTILDDVDLGSAATRAKLVGEYSGGMKRRLSVACALIGSPSVVILDEPTTGLDPVAAKAVRQTILAYRTEAAILLTSHSLTEAEAVCDRVGIFIDGQLRTIGTVADLKDRFSSGFKIGITVGKPAAVAAADAFVRRAGGASTQLLSAVGLVRIYAVARSVAVAKLYRAFERSATDAGIVEWDVVHSSLEEVFLTIVETYSKEGAAAIARARGDRTDTSGSARTSPSVCDHSSASSSWTSYYSDESGSGSGSES